MKPIVCVTEFSEHTLAALTTAAAVARRWDERLLLVRSVDEREQFPAPLRARLVQQDRGRLAREARPFRDLGFDFEEHVVAGPPDDGIAAFASRVDARLVVLGCPPLTRLDTWVLGSTAEQVATTCRVPLLLVRAASPITEAIAGQRALRIYAFVDPRDHSPAIARTLTEWRSLADEAIQWRDCPADAPRHPHHAALECATAAKAGAADLIVVGFQPRPALPLLPHPTLAGYLLREAPMSILCVPELSPVHSLDRTPAGSGELSSSGGIRPAGA